MRPTELQFRSPKEKTAEFNLPVITNQGNILFETVNDKIKPNFAKSRRFPNYEEHAKITGYRVGPGSYEHEYQTIGNSPIKGAHIYKKYHRSRDVTNNGYIFIGNHLMFDASFLLPSRKSPTQNITARIDAGEIKQNAYNTFHRLSTASNTPGQNKDRTARKRMMSPQLSDFNSSIGSHHHY